MSRILAYAVQLGYSAYTSTLKEAWRLSISGLTDSITLGLEHYSETPELSPEEGIEEDPIAQFGIIEAQRHRERGVSLKMFLGLMKYYRQSYIDLIRQKISDHTIKDRYELFLNRSFDRIEIGFCVEWSGTKEENIVHDLQRANLTMTNEKNKFLTIFESIPTPVILLNRDKTIRNINLAAVRLFSETLSPGSQYYSLFGKQVADETKSSVASGFIGTGISELLPWTESHINTYVKEAVESLFVEIEARHDGEIHFYQMKLAKNLDVSGKFDGIILILQDITSLKNALQEVKTLKGLLPICCHCKKIRDDGGYWQMMEKYIGERSDAEFSHSICPECMEERYPEEE